MKITPTVSLIAVAMVSCGMVLRLTGAPAPPAASPEKNIAAMSPEEREGVEMMAQDAIKRGDTAAISSLLDRGFNIETDLGSNCTPLWWAVSDDQIAVVKLLVARGANLNAKTSWGDDPTNRACWQGFRDIADFLVKAGGTVKDAHYGAGVGDVAYLDALEKKQPIAPKEVRDSIRYSVAGGNINTFDWFWAKLGPMDDKTKVLVSGSFCASAAQWGQLGMLKHLEKMGADPAQFGAEALENAASWNFPNVVKYLLEEGVSANAAPQGWAPILRDAAGEGYIDIVRLLVEHGADVNVKDQEGMTPLNWAAYNGKEDVCMLLLEHGADGSIADTSGENAAWSAAGGEHCPDALEVMIKKGVDVTTPDKQGETIFVYMMHFVAPSPGRVAFLSRVYSPAETVAYDEREKRTVDMLAAAGVDVSGVEGAKTPLMEAIDVGHPAAAMALIENGAKLSVKDGDGDDAFRHVLTWASAFPRLLNLVEPMLKLGVDPNEEEPVAGLQPPMILTNLEAVIPACSSSEPEQAAAFQKIVKLFMKHGGKFPGTKNKDEEALLDAAAAGDLKGMQDAIAHGANVNAAESSGLTALNVCANMGYDEAARWLLDHGADVNTYTPLGLSPLLAAVRGDQAGLVDYLISKGAKPGNGLEFAVQAGDQHIFDALVKGGAILEPGALYSCIQYGRVGMAKALLDHGANPQPDQTMDGRGNVYWAVYYEQPEILKMLLDHGADPNAGGETPLSFAQRFHKEMVLILQEAIKRRAAAKKS